MPQLQNRRPTADQLDAVYRDGYMTAGERNDKMRALARVQLSEAIGENGYIQTVLSQTAKHFNEGWENLSEAAANDPTRSVGGNFYAAGLAFWGQVQMMTSIFNAVGEVSGMQAERWLLAAGVNPTAAKVVNLAVDVGTGFVPIAGGARWGAKGLQALAATAKDYTAIRAAQKALVSADTAPAAVHAVIRAGEEAALRVFGKGLKEIPKGSSLVPGTSTIAWPAVAGGGEVAAQGASITGQKVLDDAILDGLASERVGQAGSAARGAVSVGPPTRFQAFQDSLRAYHVEMDALSVRKPHEVTMAEAEALGVRLDDLKELMRGAGVNEAQMGGMLAAMDGPVRELQRVSGEVVAGVDGAGPLLQRMWAEFFDYLPRMKSAQATAGRTVEIIKTSPGLKSLSEMLTHWDPDSMARMDSGAASRTLAEDILSLADRPGALSMVQLQAAQGGGTPVWPVVRSLFNNILLARPITHVRNFLGNTVGAGVHNLERELAGWLSIDDAKGVVRGEGWASFQGQMAAFGDGLHAWREAFKATPLDEVGKLDFVAARIPGPLGRIFGAPADNLLGMDRFFKEMARSGEVYASALREGMHKGLSRDALADYVARHRIMPSAEILKRADDVALANTYQQELGYFGEKARAFLQAGPGALYFPFVKPGVNLLKWGLNRTPGVQLLARSLYDDLIAGGVRADMAVARLTLSNMAAQFYFGLHQLGLLTDGGPVDKTLRRGWLLTKQPYSIAGKDGWIPLSNLAEPGTTPAELVADFAGMVNQLDDPSAELGAMAVVLSISRNVADNTWWRSASDILDVFATLKSDEKIGDAAVKVVARPVIGVLASPLSVGIARAVDPIQRESRSILNEIRAGVPGLSDNLPPDRDGLGDSILRPAAIGGAWLGVASPLLFRPAENDRVKKEATRLQIRFSEFPSTTGGGKYRDDFDLRAALPGEAVPVPLGVWQKDRWQVIYRNMVRHPVVGIEADLLDTNDYKTGTEALQRELFQDYLATTREKAKLALYLEDVPLAKKVAGATMGRYLPMLPPEERPAVQAAGQAGIDSLDTLLPPQRDKLAKYGFYARDPGPASLAPPLGPAHPVEYQPFSSEVTP